MAEVVRTAPLRLVPLEPAHAREIASWRYDPPYDVYDMTGADPVALVDPDLGFHAVLAGAELVGFRSFGPDGQVAGWEYDESALDTGGGMRPDLTGRGLGRAVITAGLAYGHALHRPAVFRMTVASFNTRALRAVESLGFERIASFPAARDVREFVVLRRREEPASA